jgi:hypothetical protein
MYIKLNNGQVEKYPYSQGQLRADNPNTSFPTTMPDSLLADWDVYPVKQADQPQVDHTKNVKEDTPQFINNEWVQVWEITPASNEEIDQRVAEKNAQAESNRAKAYRNESDPLFFKWQRAEATQQEWLDKVAEIKLRYPKL